MLDVVRAHLADHSVRLDHYRAADEARLPRAGALTGLDLDHYLVLRGGILTEETWVAWLTEYLTAHTSHRRPHHSPGTTS